MWTPPPLCGSLKSEPDTSSTTSSVSPNSASATPRGDQYDFRGIRRQWGSSSARKAHLHSFRSGETLEVRDVSKLPRLDTTITFSDANLEGCQHPHDDPLVIKVVMANKIVHRVLIDNGSSVDIIFAPTFDKIGIGKEQLEQVNAHLRGFSGESTAPGISTTSTHFRRPPMPSHNDDKIPHSGSPIDIQHVTRQAFSQCHKGHPFRLSYGHQIPYGEWSRNGSRRLANS